MIYEDFDLLLERAPKGFRAQVLNSSAGQASVEFQLPFSDVELESPSADAASMSSGTRARMRGASGISSRMARSTLCKSPRNGASPVSAR